MNLHLANSDTLLMWLTPNGNWGA